MNDCVFCKIVAGEIPCDKVYEDENAICFRDLNPQAPCHILVVPKKHLADILECGEYPETLGKLFKIAGEVAKKEGLDKTGFRVATNCGSDGCQSVGHFHIHVLGGKQLSPYLG